MTNIPIIFSTPMVRALLEGRKTMTRRLAWGKYVPISGNENRKTPATILNDGAGFYPASPWQRVKPGDRLYVREEHWRWGMWRKIDGKWTFVFNKAHDKPVYTEPALDVLGTDRNARGARWWKRPCIFHFKDETRLTLVVTATKIERVQKISIADALAEGLAGDLASSWEEGYRLGNEDTWADWIERDAVLYSHPNPHADDFNELTDDPRKAFRWLWESLHGEKSRENYWDANPEVVALTFTVHKCNIDAMSRDQAE